MHFYSENNPDITTYKLYAKSSFAFDDDYNTYIYNCFKHTIKSFDYKPHEL